MKITMRTGISGGRGDGTPWPEVGGVIVVGDEEGRALCAAGHAIPYVDPDDGVEKRAEVPDGGAQGKAGVKAPKGGTRARGASQG